MHAGQRHVSPHSAMHGRPDDMVVQPLGRPSSAYPSSDIPVRAAYTSGRPTRPTALLVQNVSTSYPSKATFGRVFSFENFQLKPLLENFQLNPFPRLDIVSKSLDITSKSLDIVSKSLDTWMSTFGMLQSPPPSRVSSPKLNGIPGTKTPYDS